jgi:hypothetical protein
VGCGGGGGGDVGGATRRSSREASSSPRGGSVLSRFVRAEHSLGRVGKRRLQHQGRARSVRAGSLRKRTGRTSAAGCVPIRKDEGRAGQWSRRTIQPLSTPFTKRCSARASATSLGRAIGPDQTAATCG